jgi:hypothetical protein
VRIGADGPQLAELRLSMRCNCPRFPKPARHPRGHQPRIEVLDQVSQPGGETGSAIPNRSLLIDHYHRYVRVSGDPHHMRGSSAAGKGHNQLFNPRLVPRVNLAGMVTDDSR